MTQLGSLKEIPGLGVCPHDLRVLAERVTGMLQTNSSEPPSAQLIVEHAVFASVLELGAVIEALEKADQTQWVPTLRRIRATLDCVWECAEMIETLRRDPEGAVAP